MLIRRRFGVSAFLVLTLTMAACDVQSGEDRSATTASTTTLAPPTTEAALPEAVSIVYQFMDLFNAGDRPALEDLWSEDASILGQGTFKDPQVSRLVDIVMEGLHEQIIGECHLTEPDTVYCDELHVDDLIRPAGVEWRASRVYEVESGKIVTAFEVGSNKETSNTFLNGLMDWIATEDPGLFERAFDRDADPVWRSLDGVRETVALVEDFVAQSSDYPLVPPERLANPELIGTVTGGSGVEIDVFNAEPQQFRLVEWGVERFQEAGLAQPAVDSVTFPPHQLCETNSGWSVEDEEGRRIVLCLFESEMCTDDACELVSPLARATLLHEMAHAWTKDNVDEASRAGFLDLRELEEWGVGSWSERGSEHAAEIIMWGLMEEPLDLFRLGLPPCEELEEAYEFLTGQTPLRGGC